MARVGGVRVEEPWLSLLLMEKGGLRGRVGVAYHPSVALQKFPRERCEGTDLEIEGQSVVTEQHDLLE